MDVKTADTKKEECTICLQPIQTYDKTCMNLNCDHTFHEDCIKPWCRINVINMIIPTCPNCRAKWTNIDCWCILIANSGRGDLHSNGLYFQPNDADNEVPNALKWTMLSIRSFPPLKWRGHNGALWIPKPLTAVYFARRYEFPLKVY